MIRGSRQVFRSPLDFLIFCPLDFNLSKSPLRAENFNPIPFLAPNDPFLYFTR
jgi:hypothetical protein